MAKKNIVSAMKKLSAGYGSYDAKIELGSKEDKTDMTIKVRSGLTIEEYGEMVLDIAQACFLRSENEITFAPYLMRLSCALCTAKYYTDMDIPADSESQAVFWNFWNVNRMEEKISMITHDQIYMVYDAAKSMVDELNRQNADPVNKLSKLFADIFNKVSNTDTDAQAIYDFLENKEDVLKILDRVRGILDSGDFGATQKVVAAFGEPAAVPAR